MRPEKLTIVQDLASSVKSSPFVILIDYTGMTVPHFIELRARLRPTGAECHVVKNSLLRKALASINLPTADDFLRGQTAMITGNSDVCTVAKIIKTFKSEFTKPDFRCALLDNSLLSPQQVLALADLPSKDVLRAQLLGALLAPATKLVRTLTEPASSLARILKAKLDQSSPPNP
ncbi:MAG: 50S ribosomal protein L10 [Chthoniobacterales bacterium]|nr:50S ribosomal protein L10 [Chthoniobacterales bacterium]